MKNKTFFIVAITSVLAVSTIAVICNKGGILDIRAAEETHTITLSTSVNRLTDSDGAYESGSKIVKTDQLQNDIKLNYDRVQSFDSGYYYMTRDFGTGNPAYIANDASSPIGSLISISVRGNSEAYNISYGWDLDSEGQPIYEETTSLRASPYTTVFDFVGKPSYFKFYSTDRTGYAIYEIKLTYSSDCAKMDKPFTTVDGVKYRLSSNQNYAIVVGRAKGDTTADIVIRDTVTIAGKTVPVTAMDGNLFVNDSYLRSITIPASITGTISSSFNICSNLESVYIHEDSQATIVSSFESCQKITNCIIPSRVTVGAYCFDDCQALTGFVVDDKYSPAKMKSIDGVLFNSSNTLVCYPAGKTNASYDIPVGTVQINDYAIRNCKNLLHLTVPSTVTRVGSYWLSGSNNIESIVDNSQITGSTPGYYVARTKITSFVVPAGITSIYWYAFADCANLTNIDFSNCTNLTTISDSGFKDCPISQIVIPASVTTIHTKGFDGWKSTQTIFLEAAEAKSGYAAGFEKEAKAYYYSETSQANHWHYVDGVPTLWED